MLARSQYAQALYRTNQALGNPKERITDDTLASIVHLSLFEEISFDEKVVQANWTAHVLGATEIVKLRGVRQLDTTVGRELYIAVLVGISFSCVQRQVRMPKELMDLSSKASSVFAECYPAYRLCLLLSTFSDIQFRRASRTSSPSEIIKQCLQLDETVAAAYAREPTIQVLGAASPDGPNCLGERRLNTYRALRMSLNCWILKSLSTEGPTPQILGSDDNKQLYCRANGLMAAMGEEILEATRKCLVPRVTLSSRVMVFYLYIMVEEPLMPLDIRTSARELIRFMGTEGGIPEALRATERLDYAQRVRSQFAPSHSRNSSSPSPPTRQPLVARESS